MKPTDMMRQMKALLPTDDRPGTYFMASFLLCLPSNMRDHLIAKDFKDCTKMAECADLLYSSRAGNTIAAVNTEYEVAVKAISGGRRQEFLTPRLAAGAPLTKPPGAQPPERPPAHTGRTATFSTFTMASPGASGSRETEQLPRTKHSWRRHDFFTG
jgi:hypothetical protein